MKWTVSLLLLSVLHACFASPVGLTDVDDDVIGYEDFLKDIVMAAEPRRVRRKPMEEVVGKTVFDLLSGRLPDESFERVRRDDGNQMLIMGSPFARGSPDCDVWSRDAELPMDHYQEFPYEDRDVPISMPYPQEQDDYEPYVIRSLPPKVYNAKTVTATSGISLPLADGGGAVTHTGNLGGLGLPGLGALGGGGGLGAAGLSGITAGLGVSAVGHGHKGVGSIAVPVGHDPSYITTIPFISGYELKPIYSMKKVVVKEIGKEHIGLLGHKGVNLPGLAGLPGLPGLPGLASRSAEDPSSPHGFYTVGPSGHNPNYQVLSISATPGFHNSPMRSSDNPSTPHNFYIDGPGDHHPLDLNIFFVDPAQAKEASEPELLSPEAYSDAIRTLQQQMDHLQSLKLSQERRLQPDEINCV